MTVREKSRQDKFRQLLASPNTDLGKRETTARVVLIIVWSYILLLSLDVSFVTSNLLMLVMSGVDLI